MIRGAPLRTLAAFVRRDWTTALSYRLPFVLDAFGAVLLVAIFYFVSRLVDPSTIAGQAGAQAGYFGFVVVGLGLLRLVQAGLSSFAMKLRNDQMTGTLEAMLATPAPPALIILASAAYDLARATVLATLMYVAAIALFGMNAQIGWLTLVAVVAVLPAGVALFAALGIAIAAFTMVFKQGLSLVGLVTGLLGLLGGAYFPIGELPEPLHTIAAALPFTWALDVMRSALLDAELPLGRFAGLCASAAVGLPLALLLFSRAVARSRRAGTLAHY